MKLCRIVIKGFRQFKDVVFDFTHPETGQPLNNVCFIGQNGTGKSTMLDVISRYLEAPFGWKHAIGGIMAYQMQTEKGLFWKVEENTIGFPDLPKTMTRNPMLYIRDEVGNDSPNWLDEYCKIETYSDHSDFLKRYGKWIIDESQTVPEILEENALKPNGKDLLIYCPAEIPIGKIGDIQRIDDVPKTSVSEALKLFRSFPYYHEISEATVSAMWQVLVYLIKKQENEWQLFLKKEENRERVLKDLQAEFERDYPEVLPKLGEFWNSILERAGLELDVEGAGNPVQLNDNLQAYIRLKYGDKARVPYAQLSTGIRNFIFTIGHIYLLYFNREIERGFLLIDEPENSLFPDFLFDLMEIFEKIVLDKNGKRRTQIFMATHNPIVAAQFEPYERVVLDWNNDGSVSARRGKAPKGDDPNDVLDKDFGLTSLMGKTGRAKWKEYLELKKKARHAVNDQDKQMSLVAEASRIARVYNTLERG